MVVWHLQIGVAKKKENETMSDFMKKFSLEGKVALITGASYGIGFAIASAYAEAGAEIVFNDIKQELVDKGLAAYEEKGIHAHGYVCDVTNEEQVQAMVAQIEKEVGVIDILVNNAGIIKRIPMCEMTAEQFRQVVDVDLNAPFIVSKAVIPSMIKKGHGKIINICSMMSELGRETVSAYAAAKGGVVNLTRALGAEWSQYGINVNAVSPGYFKTEATEAMWDLVEGIASENTPIHRGGRKGEITAPVCFLASDEASYVVGVTIPCDGGYTCI